MIALEIQTLSERRENLVLDIGRIVIASGFTMLRQRLEKDRRGILLTMIVSGPARGKPALSAALAALDRLNSFVISVYDENVKKPHFAASHNHRPTLVALAPTPKPTPRSNAKAAFVIDVPATIEPLASLEFALVPMHESDVAHEISVPAPVPVPVAVAVAEDVKKPHFAASHNHGPTVVAFAPRLKPKPRSNAKAAFVIDVPATIEPLVSLEFALVPMHESDVAHEISVPVPVLVAAPTPPQKSKLASLDVIPLGADVAAVDSWLPKLTDTFPDIFHMLLRLQPSVTQAARKATLLLAGQRMGAWAFERDYSTRTTLSLRDAVKSVGFPALRKLVEVEQRGEQLHILNSPMCSEGGDSGCQFYSGYLVGLLDPAMASHALHIVSVSCRSDGACECVFALSDG